MAYAPNAVVRKDAETGQVRIIEGFIKVEGGSKENPVKTAQLFIARQRKLLVETQTEIAPLRPVKTIKTPTGPHVIFERYLNDLPVFDNDVTVTMTKAGDTVNLLLSNQTEIRSAEDTVPDQSAERARQIAVAAVKSQDGVTDPIITTREKKGYLVVDDEAALVWKVSFDTRSPLGAWEVVVDADTGDVLSKGNVGHYANGRGMVFQPNPIQSTGDSSLTNAIGGCAGCDDPRLTDARVPVTLRELDDTGLLQGTYANTKRSAERVPGRPPFQRASSPADRVYDYTRRDARFREVMAYFWVTESGLYVTRELRDLEAAIPQRLEIDIHATPTNDSQYSPVSKSLQFGTGGVPDAEDAEVILHELGHAILDNQVPGFGGQRRHTEARAMAEGFGDYWAESFLERFGARREWAVFFGKWDGTEGDRARPAQGSNPPHLRRLDSPKRYPEDLKLNDEHEDGEIWSACLWQMRGILGRQKADTTILAAQFRLRKRATFSEGAAAILGAHGVICGGSPNCNAERDAIKRVFTDRGIPLPTV